MQNNIFLGGQEPLFNTPNYQDINNQMAELQRMQTELEKQKHTMSVAQQQMQQQSSVTPIWDEIERITADLTDKEFESISNNEEFKASQQTIVELINAEQLKMLRPIVESSAKGKETLESHLNLLKRLRKDVANTNEQTMELFNEYINSHSDIPFNEFIKTKRR